MRAWFSCGPTCPCFFANLHAVLFVCLCVSVEGELVGEGVLRHSLGPECAAEAWGAVLLRIFVGWLTG